MHVILFNNISLPYLQGRSCQEGHCPPKFCLAPTFFRSLPESPTQTIDSSPCCKTGPSSGPPNENVWLRPCILAPSCEPLANLFKFKNTGSRAGLHNSENSKGHIHQHRLALGRKSLFSYNAEEIQDNKYYRYLKS